MIKRILLSVLYTDNKKWCTVMGRKKNAITNYQILFTTSFHSNYAHGASVHHTNDPAT